MFFLENGSDHFHKVHSDTCNEIHFVTDRRYVILMSLLLNFIFLLFMFFGSHTFLHHDLNVLMLHPQALNIHILSINRLIEDPTLLEFDTT